MLLFRWLSNSCRVYTRPIILLVALAFIAIITLLLWKNFYYHCWQMDFDLDSNLLYLKPVANAQPPKPINHKVAKSSWSWLNGTNLSDNITLVTAYFELGSFKKGLLNVITPTKYKKWMSVYARILNPLVIYTDSEDVYKQFQQLRAQHSTQHITKLILIRKEKLWAFQIKSQIDSIFQQDGYPTFSPNTVNAEYSCIMHAKFELLQQSIDNNYFLTKYFMWIDIGYFRYETEKNNLFGLSVPQRFDENSVAYSEVCDFQNYSFKDIVWNNRVWVAGGANLGRFDVLTTFCKEYINRVKKALEERIISTDQQIIYAMYTDKEKPSSNLQLCIAGWFCLGYLSIRSWQNQNPKFNHTS